MKIWIKSKIPFLKNNLTTYENLINLVGDTKFTKKKY